jgi:hypothetical protein
MTKQEVQDMVAKLCGVLTELGCEYHYEADNRSNRHSHYIYVRRPKYMEIRVSDHPANKIRGRKAFDIGPHGMPLDLALEEIRQRQRDGK